MTKSFSAAATLLLRDEGAFRLDDPVGRLVPELESLRGPTSDAAPITVRDLLSMTGGFVTDDAWADRNLDLTDDDFDAIVASGPVFAVPTGTEFEYSNFGYAVLGRVVHRVTGITLQTHVTERLLGAAGDDQHDMGAAGPQQVGSPPALARRISQINKAAKPRKDMYPIGINAKARSGGSKKVLSFAYRGARIPACKKKSNPIMDNQANNVSLI